MKLFDSKKDWFIYSGLFILTVVNSISKLPNNVAVEVTASALLSQFVSIYMFSDLFSVRGTDLNKNITFINSYNSEKTETINVENKKYYRDKVKKINSL